MRSTRTGLGIRAVALWVGCGGGEIDVTVSGLAANGLVLSKGSETTKVARGKSSLTFPTEFAEGAVCTM